MSLLDYYRQFEGLSEEEVNAGLREEAAERKRKALTRLETLDLSHTTWPELPHPRIVNSITFVARRGLQRYPHLKGIELRNELADAHSAATRRLRCWSAIRGCSCFAASPRRGGSRACVSATPSAGTAPLSCSRSSSRTSASPRSPRRVPTRRCTAAPS